MHLESVKDQRPLDGKLSRSPRVLVLSEQQRLWLKEPLGFLIRGSPATSSRALKELLSVESPPRLILVGDAVSRYSIQIGIKPDVIIIDMKEKRREATKFKHGADHVFTATNAPGTIELETWATIDEATKKGSSIVVVDGEEDLLTLVAIMVAPLGSMVVYGQPDEGIVLVRVSFAKKKQIDEIIRAMQKGD